MTKKIVYKSILFLLMTHLCSSVYAGSGFFGAAAGVIAYTQNAGTMTTTSSFGTDIGNTSSLVLNGGYNHVWRDGSGNICSGTLNYRIYQFGGTPPGSFVSENLGFSSNHSFTTIATPHNISSTSGNDQRWGQVTGSTDLLSGLSVGTKYTLEFYFSATGNTTSNSGCGDDLYYNNGGSNFTIAFTVAAPLPVDMINFSGSVADELFQLKWSTASELNASHFIVHGSVDGLEKYAVGMVMASGNSHVTQHYSYAAPVFSQRVFYFLEQVDMNGSSDWYGPIRLDATDWSNTCAFFTASGLLQVNSDLDRYSSAKLSTLDGTSVIDIRLESEIQQVAVPVASCGIYLLELKGHSSHTVIPLFKF